MRVSKTLITSAAAAAIVSVIGLAYAETSVTDDTAQMQEQTRNDASTTPAGAVQPGDTPSALAVPGTGSTGAGSSSTGSTSMPMANFDGASALAVR